AVRDPIALAESVRDAGLVAPEVRVDSSGLPTDGSWLCKSVASGGGRGIRPWMGERPRSGRSVYFQERIEGLPLSAIFVRRRATGSDLGDRAASIRSEGFVAKAIVFAGRPFTWPTSPVELEADPTRFPEIADVPRPGTPFQTGEPVLTVFARGDSPEECRGNL